MFFQEVEEPLALSVWMFNKILSDVKLVAGFLMAITVSVGAAYSFTRVATANLREKDDHWNATVGGFVGGAVGGLRR